MRRIRLVIADRRPIVLHGFASLFAAERDFEVVASCPNGTSCLEAIRNATPDVVLVEDGFSDVTASEMLAVASAENLSTRLVFYTASVARGDVAAAIAAGACNAISMRAKPETLLKSLRLVAPRPDPGPSGKEENGGIDEDVLAALTDEERKIMRLAAYGMSNKAMARQLEVSPAAVKERLNLIFQKVQVDNRTELAALVLSRLSGGIGALAALIFAALDDVRAAHSQEADHTPADSFTLMAADDTARIATIVVTPKKSVGASGTTASATVKAARVDNPRKGTLTLADKVADFSVDTISSTIQPAALNYARPSLGSSSAFMMGAAGVLIYELDALCRSAQAFEFGNIPTDFSTSATANGSRESATLNISGSANANADGFDGLAWLGPGKYDQSFAFDSPRSDSVFIPGPEIQIADTNAMENGSAHTGNESSPYAKSAADAVIRSETIDKLSATTNALAGHSMDHGGSGETTASDTSQPFEHGASTSSAGEEHSNSQSQGDLHADEGDSAAAKQHAEHDPPGHDSNHGQSQRDLHASDQGSAAAEQHGKHDPPGHDANRQSQRDLDASEGGSAAADQHAKHDPPGHDSNGQSERDLHASEGASAVAEQHVKHDPPGHDSDDGQSQRDLHVSERGSAAPEPHARHDAAQENEANRGQSEPDLHARSVNVANNPHSGSSLNPGGKDQPADENGETETAGAPPLGDSFHFKVMGGSKASDSFALHVGHGPDSMEHGLHPAGHDGADSIQETDLASLSVAEQNAVDHGKGAEHHLMHDLFV